MARLVPAEDDAIAPRHRRRLVRPRPLPTRPGEPTGRALGTVDGELRSRLGQSGIRRRGRGGGLQFTNQFSSPNRT